MAIPKVIYQTFKSTQLPFITRWHISRMRNKNPDYAYEFYDDARIEQFLEEDYDQEVVRAYRKIQIGAVKADFFRYTILYKKGGIYLDIDSRIAKKLDDFIRPDDEAIISFENNNEQFYVQWGLIYAPSHPFLEKTVELMLDNIKANRFPHSSHEMTGPTVYTKAIRESLEQNPNIPYRLMGIDYNGNMKFKYPFNKLIYEKGEHWKEVQKTKPILRKDENEFL
ncbi:MAG: glycosyl transferase [Chitinophagaceae bacterium]